MASGFKTRISKNCSPFGKVQATKEYDVAFKVYYAGAWYPHGPEARDMAIDIIHETFPGAQVEWERTRRVPEPIMVIDETTSGDEVAAFKQIDMSDDFLGPGVELLRQNLIQYKKEHS